jgi:hypothetical protein
MCTKISQLSGRIHPLLRRTIATVFPLPPLLLSYGLRCVAVAQVGQPRQVAGLQVEAIVVAGLHLFQPWAAQAGQSCRATIHLPVPEETAGQGPTCKHFMSLISPIKATLVIAEF